MNLKLSFVLIISNLFALSAFSNGWDQATCEGFKNVKENVIPDAPSMDQGHAGLCASFAMSLAISKAKGLSGSDSISPLSLAKSVENWKKNSEIPSNKNVSFFPDTENEMRKRRMNSSLEAKFQENKYGVSKGGAGAVNDGGGSNPSFGVNKYRNSRMEGVTLDALAQAALEEKSLCNQGDSTFAGESLENWTQNGRTNYSIFTDQNSHENNSGNVSQLMGSISNLYKNTKSRRYKADELKEVFERSKIICDRDIKKPIIERIEKICDKFNKKRQTTAYFNGLIKPCNKNNVKNYVEKNMNAISNNGGTTDLLGAAENLSSKYINDELLNGGYVSAIKERGPLNVDFAPEKLSLDIEKQKQAIATAEKNVVDTEAAYQAGLAACQAATKKREKEELCGKVKRGSPYNGELLTARDRAKRKYLPDAKSRLAKMQKDKDNIDQFVGPYLTGNGKVDIMAVLNKELEKEGIAPVGGDEVKTGLSEINQERIDVMKRFDSEFSMNEGPYQEKYQEIVNRVGRVRAVQIVSQVHDGKPIRTDDTVVLAKAREIAPLVEKRKERILHHGKTLPKELVTTEGNPILSPYRINSYLKRKVAEGSTNGLIVSKAREAREGVVALQARGDLFYLKNCWGRTTKPCNSDTVEKRRKSLLRTLKKNKVSPQEAQAFGSGTQPYKDNLTNTPDKYLNLLESGDLNSEEAGTMFFYMKEDFAGTIEGSGTIGRRSSLAELQRQDYQGILDGLFDTDKARKRKDKGMKASDGNLLKFIAGETGESSDITLAMMEQVRDLRKFKYEEREQVRKHSDDISQHNNEAMIADAAKKYDNYNQCLAEEIEDKLLQKYSRNGVVQCSTDNDVIYAMTALSNLTDSLGDILDDISKKPNPFWNTVIDCKNPENKTNVSDLKMTAYKMKDEQLKEYPLAQREAKMADALKESLVKDTPMVVGLCLGMFKNGCKEGDGHAMAVVGMKASWDGSKCNVSYKLKNSWGDDCSRTTNASKGIKCSNGIIDVPHGEFMKGTSEVLSVAK
ncbi:MAG: hypothetical protein KC493_06210 [Bacteriovoracaceae bacterium]|nr:hypothetical protein [Bacteriovoracaceae bacterium]